MIRKLRLKFVCVTMLSVGVIFCLMLVAINLSMTFSIDREADVILNRVIEADGRIDRPKAEPGNSNTAEKQGDPGRMTRISNIKRTFAVRLNHNGTIRDIVDNGSSSFTEEEIASLTEQILKSGKYKGEIQSHRYLMKDTSYGTLVAFLDCTHEKENMNRLIRICLATGAVCILFLLAAAICLAYWATIPVQEGFKRQKQFVADASHELKTPLAVIGANASVLEGACGKNQWTDYIQSEVKRMNRLVNDMLRLARMEQPEQILPMEQIDLSKTALEILLPYESVAFEQSKSFEYDVEPDLAVRGNKDSLSQMIHIFTENAFQYSGTNGKICVTIKNDKKKIYMEFYNTGSGISEEAQAHIFERFYREDSSHSRKSGGYGLGLSIAKSILDRHHAKVRIKSDEKTFASFQIHL